ncbi:MAG: polysaccharide biosynthesis C-terminal domain-containing protein [Candidatus Margulisbacteria bacterium]|nr:polysaccharide biosynthesis C-terminal domain-containing protein [Candidatus Margulisiibacteriota bacterium]
MLNYFHSSKEVAIYQVALKFSVLSIIILQIMVPVLQSVITRLIHENDFEKKIKQILQKVIIPSLSFWVLFCIGFYYFGKPVLLMYGEYGGAYKLVFMLSAVKLLNIFFGIIPNLLMLKLMSGTLLKNISLTLAINIALNIILIPKYGVYGAAFASWVAILCQYIGLTIISIRKLNIYLHKYLILYFGTVLVLFGLMMIRNDILNIVVIICAGIAIYLERERFIAIFRNNTL